MGVSYIPLMASEPDGQCHPFTNQNNLHAPGNLQATVFPSDEEGWDGSPCSQYGSPFPSFLRFVPISAPVNAPLQIVHFHLTPWHGPLGARCDDLPLSIGKSGR